MDEYHKPVLFYETLDALRITKGAQYIDATLGGGSIAWGIVERGGKVLGIDADNDAVAYVKKKFLANSVRHKTRNLWKIIHGNFRDIERIAENERLSAIRGIVFDLGVSSYQLDTPEKGFGYRYCHSPLDLRFDKKNIKVTAADILNKKNEAELFEIFSRFAEEQHSDALASSIVRARKVKKFVESGDLYEVVERVIGNTKYRHKTLARIFQALRITVNDELNVLKEGLSGAEAIIELGGRVAVLSYHSLEDRIVKQWFRKSTLREITTRPITPSNKEISENRRARSAKLRVAEKRI